MNISKQAKCSKAIRLELKEKFPGVKFRVTSQSYSGGESVCVYWINGPEQNKVHIICKKYQEGTFNGMNDCYEYTNKNKTIPQVKFVFVQKNN